MIITNLESDGFKKSIEDEIVCMSQILSDEIYEYLMKLLNLDVSVISKGFLSDTKFKALSKIDFFNIVVVYNLYNIIKNNLLYDSKLSISSSIYGFLVEYKDVEKIELLKFVNKEMSVFLSSRKPLSVSEQLERVNDEINRLENRIDFLNFSSESEKLSISRRLYYLKNITPAYVKQQYECLLEEYDKQREMTDRFLKFNGLTVDDFDEIAVSSTKKYLVKKYPHTTIYIKK